MVRSKPTTHDESIASICCIPIIMFRQLSSVRISAALIRATYHLSIGRSSKDVLALLNQAVSDGHLDRRGLGANANNTLLKPSRSRLSQRASCAQGFLIPDTTRRDMAFDFAEHNLCISTATGLIKTLWHQIFPFQLSVLLLTLRYAVDSNTQRISVAKETPYV